MYSMFVSKETNMTRKTPGPVTAKDTLAVLELANTTAMFAKLVDLSRRMKAAGLTACEILNCKPWELPTVGGITPEQLATVIAAVEAAERTKNDLRESTSYERPDCTHGQAKRMTDIFHATGACMQPTNPPSVKAKD